MNDVQKIIFEDDNDDDQIWERTIYAVGIVSESYFRYNYKEPCMDSFQTGMMWLLEIMRGNDKRCLNMFRMDKDIFINLCQDLEKYYGLAASPRMSTLEKVGIFLFILSLGASNRQAQERFQRSDETISRVFREVLKSMMRFSIDVIKPKDLTFSTIPLEIQDDERYMPHFKDCIGAIDGTHVSACVEEHEIIRYIGRKGVPTQNIMAACSFDMQFTFVLAGWEGKYYLVDAGYSQIEGFLAPYKGTRYHLPEFQRSGRPKGLKETFNRWHSSLRSCIERTFGVWKARWKILRLMSSYPFHVQRDIVITSMALHNYIRRKALDDPAFSHLDKNPNFMPPDIFNNLNDDRSSENCEEGEAAQMKIIKDQIAHSLMRARRDL
ncbi:uncharacterized protein LOC126672750 [Mercurialis annua]|uniref:uncharacterized protein LOC126672750 n=1 Tax=Mercurialis annua TaxID=3986 RepID=UPI00215F52CF|nr:uncharacterized protein LOC126672750 [Mercurialis annua]